ncbi:hypothetical protein HTZ84_22250 [Haloterrigena sp. SYSU A558-1]|uniref:DUF2188 domain-containing protein n=1 Tax=Haloterrigena gelatinilytica TaxID=2741724 RepID=A0ABX2LIJ6_9EURY|nr:hypothetical protein [Haloterrigena gelatinilytica]NUC74989.1 hypothetical protein [Haloterrigena gelatinilytica]
MTEPIPKRPADQYAHVDRQQDRDVRDADAYYTMAVFEEGDQYVATQDGASLEARGFSPAEAIANYANAVDAKNNGEQVVRDA